MSSARSLTIGLIVAIIFVRAWLNGRLSNGLASILGPYRKIGEA